MKAQEWDFSAFKDNFFKKTGLNLDCYKDQQMERRIRHMIQREKCEGFYDFYLNLSGNPEFLHKFMNYITINTSGFFRDVSLYGFIRDNVLPDLKNNFNSLKIWSAGCSNGEEPYTISILLDELSVSSRSKIIGSDFDEKALDKAREGIYKTRQVDKVPKDLLNKCFEQVEDEDYLILPKYKKNVEFQKENLLELGGVEKGQMNMVLCRNVFIYFKSDVQEKIISYISRILVKGGYFVIGCAEYINDPASFGLKRIYPAVYIKER